MPDYTHDIERKATLKIDFTESDLRHIVLDLKAVIFTYRVAENTETPKLLSELLMELESLAEML